MRNIEELRALAVSMGKTLDKLEYEMLIDATKEIERLTAESTEWESRCYKLQDIIDDYKSRNEKAIWYIERCRDYHTNYHKEEKIFPDEITSLLMILQGEDKDDTNSR